MLLAGGFRRGGPEVAPVQQCTGATWREPWAVGVGAPCGFPRSGRRLDVLTAVRALFLAGGSARRVLRPHSARTPCRGAVRVLCGRSVGFPGAWGTGKGIEVVNREPWRSGRRSTGIAAPAGG